MTDESEPITDQQVDAYLDGLLTPAERDALEVHMRAHPELADKIEQLSRVDAAAKRLFPQEPVPEAHLSELLTDSTTVAQTALSALDQRRGMSYALRVAIVALAASLMWIVVTWQVGTQATKPPYFQPQPVAKVYQEVVRNGFEPYYECREEDRFADTFSRRQGHALHLAALPTGTRMLGLSYPGGLSRDTTAMLCRVDEEPVIVFIDRLEKDQPNASRNDDGKLQVHRVARDGLVFYEVSPFARSRVIEYLVAD